MVRVGQVLGAFGLAGAVKVRTLTDFDERFDPGSELLLGGAAHRVEWSRRQPGGMVVKLSGVDDRALAQARHGAYLEIPDEDLRPLPAGRWYHHQLIGLAVATAGGRDLGAVADVLSGTANDVWVARREEEEHLIPATQGAVLSVDIDEGRITVADWLLDVEDA